jgi:hypothetical protein
MIRGPKNRSVDLRIPARLANATQVLACARVRGPQILRNSPRASGSVAIQPVRDRPLHRDVSAMQPMLSERQDRRSDAPMSVELSGSLQTIPVGWASKIPPSWIGMSGYLVAGIFLGLVLILALTVTRGDSEPTAAAGVVTDNVVHLHNADIGSSCWSGIGKDGPARVTVSMEVGLDGKVRYAAASGESSLMRGCVESHVKNWEFLPQSNAQAMVLPFEIDRR